MSSENAAPSPAANQSGDGKQTAANVSAHEAVQRFVNAEQPPSAPPTADTKAPETPAVPAEGSPETSPESAAEPAQTSSPEAQPDEAPETPEKKDTEGPAKTEGEADDVLSPEHSQIDTKLKEKIQKRIDKEVGKRKALEAQLEQVRQQQTALAQQLQQATQKAAADTPDPKAPIPEVKTPAELVQHRQAYKVAMENVEALLDSEAIETVGSVDYNGKTYTKAELKTYRREIRKRLDDEIPAQQEYFAQQAETNKKRTLIQQAAVAKFPFLAEPNNSDVATAHGFFQQNHPSLVDSPDYLHVLGAYIHGIKVKWREEQEAAEKAKKPEVKETPRMTPPPAKIPPKPPGDQVAVSTTGGAPRVSPDAAARAALQNPDGATSRESAAEQLAKRDALRHGFR